MKVIARFDPPDALAAAAEWRDRHGAELAALPPDAVRIDTGRALDGGDFVQISVEDLYADGFASD